MPRKSELTGVLRRGSACLSCRRRKLRCDGVRPVCLQCSSMRRGHECAYDDSGRKSRTQTLREKMVALEAKVRELEHRPSSSKLPFPTSTSLSIFGNSIDDNHPHPANPAIHQMDLVYTGLDPIYPNPPHSWSAFDYGYDEQNGVSPASSSSHSSMSMTFPLGTAIPQYIDTQHTVSPLAFTDSAGTSVDGPSDRFLNEPSTTLTIEMHDILIQTFINHRKQCCLYSNTSRFDPSSSATVYQNTPPSSALMSAIYLMGSFFAHIPVLEKQMLQQTQQEVARSLHNQEQLMDLVQALCLLAQYFFFTNRPIEGNAHLKNAKQMATDFGLNQVSYSAFHWDLEYPFDSASYAESPEKAAIFWQMFMVDRFWSSSNDCCEALRNPESPCQNITTPLPVLEEAQMDVVAVNSPIYALFEGVKSDSFRGYSLSVSAFKVMASCVFDRSLRVNNMSTTTKDGEIWAYHRSTELALDRLSALVHPFTWRDTHSSEKGSVDTDLYTVHSLILASTIHLQLDNIINLKISWAAKKVVELVNHLSDHDYQFLDPVLSICWSSIIKIFRRMIESATGRINTNGASTSTTSYTVAFLSHCVDVLLSALQNLSSYVPLAETLLTTLENFYTPLYHGLIKTLPSFGKEAYVHGQNLVV